VWGAPKTEVKWSNVQGAGFRVWSAGSRVQRAGCRVWATSTSEGLKSRVWNLVTGGPPEKATRYGALVRNGFLAWETRETPAVLAGKMQKALPRSKSGHLPAKVAAPPGRWPTRVN
jgi:hypothetical protein